METMGLYPRKCARCGAEFECRIEYAYKRVRKTNRELYDYFCSYKCVRAYDAENERKPTPRQQEILRLLNKGMEVADVAHELNASSCMVKVTRDKWSVAAR